MTAKPLAGMRILTFEQFGAGPYCSMFLADMGLEEPGLNRLTRRHGRRCRQD